jgi:hypothetical protein
MRYLGLVRGMVHCEGDGPERCAEVLVEELRRRRPRRVGLVGLQPAFARALAPGGSGTGGSCSRT